MDLSVIIPCYNTGNYIHKMLNSLKEQEHLYKVEYIFVLNNCTDNTEAVIRDSKIDCKILYCKEQGAGPARNVGLDNSTGDYIWFMDSDDWLLSPYAINTVMSCARGKALARIGFESNLFKMQYFSMVWQYCLSRVLIGGTRFTKEQPREDDRFMKEILWKLGLNEKTYLFIPSAGDFYYYYYGREGSNMYRYIRGEKI